MLRTVFYFYQVKNWVLAIVLLVASSLVWAGSAQVEVLLEQDEMAIGDEISVQVSVKNLSDAGRPTPPQIEFGTIEGPFSTSQNTTFINGNMSSQLVYTYRFMAEKQGQFTLPPFAVMAEGKKYHSNTVTLSITANPAAGGNLPSAQQGRRGAHPNTNGLGADDNDPAEQGAGLHPPIILRQAILTSHKPFVGELLVYELTLMYRVRLLSQPQLQEPDFKNVFWVEDLKDQTQYTVRHNGIEYQAIKIKKILFPLRAGKLALKPASIIVDITDGSKSMLDMDDPFADNFGGLLNMMVGRPKRTRVRSTPIELEIRALPATPPGFPSGNIPVGNYDLKAKLSNSNVKVGESSTLTVNISGEGNIHDISEQMLAVGANNTNIKLYPDKPVEKVFPHKQQLASYKELKWAIVPLKPGNISLGEIKLAVFSPKTESYLWLKSPPLEIIATGAAQEENLVTQSFSDVGLGNTGNKSQKVTNVGQDLFDFHLSAANFKNGFFSQALAEPEVVMAFSLAPQFLLLLWMSSHGYRKKRTNFADQRKKAFSLALSELKNIPVDSKPEALSKILREYLACKFCPTPVSLTSEEAQKLVADVLSGHASDQQALVKFLQECDLYTYANVTVSAAQMETLKNQLNQYLMILEKKGELA